MGARRLVAWLLAAAVVPAALPVRAQGDDGGAQIEEEPARLSDEAELSRATSLFDSGRYAQCAARLQRFLDPEAEDRFRDPSVIERARVYAAACLLGAGERERAEEVLRAALRANPQMRTPDSLVFPQAVIDIFLQVQEELRDELRAAEQERIRKARAAAEKAKTNAERERERIAELEKLAARETVVVHNRRWLSYVPFGVGQFQNGDTGLGFLFMTAELGLGATFLAALVVPHYYQAEYQRRIDAGEGTDAEQLNGILRDWQTVQTVTGWSFLGVAVLGIVEAQLSYEPIAERRVKQRELPDRLKPQKPQVGLAPLVLPSPGGGQLGITGRF